WSMSTKTPSKPPLRPPSQQSTLAGYVASSPMLPPPPPQTVTTREEREERARSLMDRYRQDLGCSGCGRSGTLTFTVDRLPHLRIQCRGKDPSCRRSWTAAAFLKWAEPILQDATGGPCLSSPLRLPSPSPSTSEAPPSGLGLADQCDSPGPTSPLDPEPFPCDPDDIRTPPPQLGKRAPSASPPDAPALSRLRADSPDPRLAEIVLLRKMVESLREELLSTRAEVKALREQISMPAVSARPVLVVPPLLQHPQPTCLSPPGPRTSQPAPPSLVPVPPLSQPMTLDPVEFPPLLSPTPKPRAGKA